MNHHLMEIVVSDPEHCEPVVQLGGRGSSNTGLRLNARFLPGAWSTLAPGFYERGRAS